MSIVTATTDNPPTPYERKKLTRGTGIITIYGKRCRIMNWRSGQTGKFNRIVEAYGKKWGLRKALPIDGSYDYIIGYVR